MTPMPISAVPAPRTAKSVHGRRAIIDDPAFETGLADWLSTDYGGVGLVELYGRFAAGDGPLDALMRRAIWKAGARRCGPGLQVASQAGFKHLETFEIGIGVFIGTGAYIQGRHDGTCTIGDHVWIGPHAYFDARHLILEDYVGWGPGARVLGSEHTGLPVEAPIITTDLEIRPVRIGAGADIGTSAVILPGVNVGRGAIVGAGAVVVADVAPFAVVAGVPARFLKWRPGTEQMDAPVAGGGTT